MRQFNKLWGIGLPRTGTRSLNALSQRLGLRSLHFTESTARTIVDGVLIGDYEFKVLEDYRSLWNAVNSCFPQIDKAYPNSLFVMSTRNIDSWLKSCKQNYPATNRSPMSLINFGCYVFNRDRFAWIYEEHNKRVKEYFADRPNDVLWFSVFDEPNADRMSEFLGLEERNIPVPHLPRDRRKNY